MMKDLVSYIRSLIGNFWFLVFFILSLISTAATFYASFHPGFLLPRETLVAIALLALLVSPYGVYKQQAGRIRDLETENSHLRDRLEGDDGSDVANLISELEDNLMKAKDPISDRFFGGAYMRPSSDCWKAVRNANWVSGGLRKELGRVYAEVERWCSIVDSGVKPGLGSPEMNRIVVDLSFEIPRLLEELRKVRDG